MKNLILSIVCVFALIGTAFADGKLCQNDNGQYCININVKNTMPVHHATQNNDLCFVLQLNGLQTYAKGNIPIKNLPTVLFSITKAYTSYGKPLDFKILKASVVPSGQCGVTQAYLEPVVHCDLMEYAVTAGISRSMTLSESEDHTYYTCEVR